MPMAMTTVPAVLSALVALGQAVLPAVTVFDGAPDIDNLPDTFLSIGWSRDEDEPGVDGDLEDQGNYSASESYAVHCVLSVATGDTGGTAVADRRTEVMALWTAFGTALRADPSIGGALGPSISRAVLGSFAWVYGQTAAGGTFAEIEFDIDVTAEYLGAP